MSTASKTKLKEVEKAADSELPDGWAIASVLELAQLIRGVSYEKGEAALSPGPQRVALLRANNIDGLLKFEDLQYVPAKRVSPDQLLRLGDVVIAMSSGSKSVVGKAATLEKSWAGTFGAFCGVLRPSIFLDPKYFGLYFQTREYRDFISQISAGVNINNLKREYFAEIDLRVAPFPEQQRIAQKVYTVTEKIQKSRKRLIRTSLMLRRFRETVLAAACSGKLTEDWRIGHPVDEPASKLLERIVTERQKTQPHNSCSPEMTDEAEIPETWTWAKGSQLFDWGSGKFLPKKNQKPGPYPIYGGNGILGEHKDFLVDRPTLVIGRVGAQCGNVYATAGPAWVTDNAIYAVQIAAGLSLTYIRFVFEKINLNANAGGSGQPFVSQETLNAVVVPLPPKLEQVEIVRRVAALFRLADAIDKRVAAATLRANNLTQAVLAKAFRGELVPTEAELARRERRDYEPASVLLERIKVGRQQSGSARTRIASRRQSQEQ